MFRNAKPAVDKSFSPILANNSKNLGENPNLKGKLSARKKNQLPSHSLGQHSLTGLWEDAVAMRQNYVTCSPNLQGFLVIDDELSKSNGKTLLTYLNNQGNDVILSAPWGVGGAMKVYEGMVMDNGTRIRWFGERGNLDWFKIHQ